MAIHLGSIPPVPSVVSGQEPHHLHCTSDGRRIVYGTDTGVVSRFLPDQTDNKLPLIESFVGNVHNIEVSASSPDAQIIAGGDTNGKLYLWRRTRDGVILKTQSIEMDGVRITDLSFSDDSRRLAVVGVDKHALTVGVCVRVDDGTVIGPLESHRGGINSTSYRHKKPYIIATGGVDGFVGFHSGDVDIKLLRKVMTAAPVNCVRFSPNGEHLVSCGNDGMILGWMITSGEIEKQMKVSTKPLLSCVWSHDSGRIAVVSLDQKVRIIDFEAGVVMDEIMIGIQEPVTPVGITWTSTDWLVVLADDNRLWGYKTDQQQTFLVDQQFLWQGVKGPITTITADSFSNRILVSDSLGTLLFVSSQDSEPKVSNMTQLCHPRRTVATILGRESGIAVTEDSMIYLFSLLKDVVINAKTISALHSASAKTKQDNNTALFKSINAHQSVKSIVSYADGDTSLQIGGPTAMSPTKDAWITGLHYFETSPIEALSLDDGRTAAVFAKTGDVYIYPFNLPGAEFVTLWNIKLSGQITAAAVTPDGGLLAVALAADDSYPPDRLKTGRSQLSGRKYLIELYEINDSTTKEGFQFVCVYDTHISEISKIALNSSGTFIASADTSFNIHVIEIETGKQIINSEWKYHTNQITSLVWSPDGEKMASGSLDGNIALWNIRFPQRRFPILNAHLGGVTALLFVFNAVLLSGGNDGSMSVYELPQEESNS